MERAGIEPATSGLQNQRKPCGRFRLLADSAYLRGKEKEAIRELEINGRIDRLKAQLTSALGVSLD
jgi:hypothetical protein